MQNLAASEDIRILSLNEKLVRNLTSGGIYNPYTLPTNTYPGQVQFVTTIGVTAMLIGNQAMPEERVSELLNTMLKSVNAVARKEMRAAFLTQQTAQIGISIPLHPAAEKFYAHFVQNKTKNVRTE